LRFEKLVIRGPGIDETLNVPVILSNETERKQRIVTKNLLWGWGVINFQ
jgi:hypothetical protein